MTTTVLDEIVSPLLTTTVPAGKRPGMPRDPKEKKLSANDRSTLEYARAGYRDPDRMAGWTFRFHVYGLAGRRAVQVMPWGSDHWFFVEWCPSAKSTKG